MTNFSTVKAAAYGFQFDNSYLTLPSSLYTEQKPQPVAAPELVVFNKELATQVGLDFSSCSDSEKASLFAGNTLMKEGSYLSQAYAGHQFGGFTILGDGRANLIGEHITPSQQHIDLQFKGSGKTPYSRGGDGRAALGPMLREYILSEAMHYLGIPTSRSLAVVATGEQVARQTPLPGAILTRIASSHLRIGTFEFAAIQKDQQLLASLTDYTIKRHYPHLAESKNQALALLKAVVEQQARLITHWMRVGFIHGVMNTDNMTLSGETIDYGPCAFMDHYDENTVFSSIDRMGRYAYTNQPRIAHWNLAVLAQALLPLLGSTPEEAVALAEEAINEFPSLYQKFWLQMMKQKLGLSAHHSSDAVLITNFLNWLQSNHADFTLTFRELSQPNKPHGKLYESNQFSDWYDRWQTRLNLEDQPIEKAVELMRKTNPAVIPRNHKVEQALAAAEQNNYQPLNALLRAIRTPYESDTNRSYQAPPQPHERVHQTFCGT